MKIHLEQKGKSQAPRVLVCAAALLVFGLGLLTLRAAQQTEQGKFDRPIMMDSNGPGTDLFVLDAWGTLHEFHVGEKGLEEFRRISLPDAISPSDMSYSPADKQESVLIAGTLQGHGVVVRYALDGSSLRSWSFKNICSGIDYGPDTQVAYVATSDSKEIYRLDMQGTEGKYVARIPQATKLGPLAYDEKNKKIYVADTAAGNIYQYSIAAKTSSVLASQFGAPTALSYDAATRRLYVADPGRRGIFTVDTQSGKSSAMELASGTLKSPYGMALLSGDRVAVADYGANKVSVFSDKGALLFQFPETN